MVLADGVRLMRQAKQGKLKNSSLESITEREIKSIQNKKMNGNKTFTAAKDCGYSYDGTKQSRRFVTMPPLSLNFFHVNSSPAFSVVSCVSW